MVISKNSPNNISPEFSKILIHSMIEILGKEKLLRVLKQAHIEFWLNSKLPTSVGLTMDEYARFLDGLISTYGKLSAQGLMQRIGRVTFQNVRRQFEAIKNLGTTEHRMTPLRKRLEGDLLEMGRILADSMGCQLAVNPEGRDWYVAISGCIGIKDHDSLSSYFIKGLLEKFLEWSDSRKDYRVEEIDTPKDAVSCIFRIQILLVE